MFEEKYREKAAECNNTELCNVRRGILIAIQECLKDAEKYRIQLDIITEELMSRCKQFLEPLKEDEAKRKSHRGDKLKSDEMDGASRLTGEETKAILVDVITMDDVEELDATIGSIVKEKANIDKAIEAAKEDPGPRLNGEVAYAEDPAIKNTPHPHVFEETKKLIVSMSKDGMGIGQIAREMATLCRYRKSGGVWTGNHVNAVLQYQRRKESECQANASQ